MTDRVANDVAVETGPARANPQNTPAAAAPSARHDDMPRPGAAFILVVAAAVMCIGIGVLLGFLVAGDLSSQPAPAPEPAPEPAPGRADAELPPKAPQDGADGSRIIAKARDLTVRGEYRSALAVIAKAMPTARLSDEQKAEIDRLAAGIWREMFRQAFVRHMKAADQHIDGGWLEQAQAEFDSAKEGIREAELAEYLDAPAAKALADEIAAGLRRLQSAREHVAAARQARQAREKADLDAEREALIRAIQAADQAEPPEGADALKKRLRDVEAAIAYAEILAVTGEGDVDQALMKLQDFRTKYPDHKEAKLLQKALKTDREHGQLIAQGDSAFQKQAWVEAKASYMAAIEIVEGDDVLKERIALCNFEQKMLEVRQVWKEGRFDDASAGVNEAKALHAPSADRAEAWLAAAKKQKKYDADVQAARDAIDQKDWRLANVILRDIESRTQEVVSLRRELSFKEHMVLAESAVAKEQYRTAYAYLNLARASADTSAQKQQVADLLAKIGPKLPPETSLMPPAGAATPRTRPRPLDVIRAPLYVPSNFQFRIFDNSFWRPYVVIGGGDQIYFRGKYWPRYRLDMRRRGDGGSGSGGSPRRGSGSRLRPGTVAGTGARPGGRSGGTSGGPAGGPPSGGAGGPRPGGPRSGGT